MSNAIFRSVFALSIAFGTVALSLAGDAEEAKEIGRVKGLVSLDDTPLAEAFVCFEPLADNAPFACGVTHADGSFALFHGVAGRLGAPVGKYIVRIRTARSKTDEERVPAKYNSKSILRAEVKAGENRVQFFLKSRT